jgi:hypothetical protein
MVDVMNFEGGPFDGMKLIRNDEGHDDWPFQVCFDVVKRFDERGMLTGCVRHTYQMFLSGENTNGENWAVYQHEAIRPIKVNGTEVEQ